ncbi:MAG: CCXG family PEP-CTERM protein [Hyphomicrobiales bacterium]
MKSVRCLTAAACVLGFFAIGPANASEITYYSRPIVATANSSAQDYLNNWNAALTANPVAPAGYGEATISRFHNVQNQKGIPGGTNNSISEFYNIDFFIPESVGIARWKFRFTPDFGLGGAAFLDGKAAAFNSANLDGSQVVEFTVRLKPGEHNIQLYGQENCCDGDSDGQFKPPGGPPLTSRDVGNFAFTDGWNLK